MTQAQRPRDRHSKRQAKAAREPAAAVVASFASEALELDRSKLVYPNDLFVLDGLNLGEVCPAQKLLA
jgi:hypothetical protein